VVDGRGPEIDGLTQAKSVNAAHDMATDYIALALDIPAASFGISMSRNRCMPTT
jgi:hypothetical protein